MVDPEFLEGGGVHVGLYLAVKACIKVCSLGRGGQAGMYLKFPFLDPPLTTFLATKNKKSMSQVCPLVGGSSVK